jgi:membrane dipeptidase
MTIRWDAHACLPLHPDASFAPLERFAAAGVNYVSINVGMDMNPLTQVMSVIAGFRVRLKAEPDKYLLARHVADIDRAKASNRLAVGFDLEGAMPLLDRPEMVALYRDLGVNQIHFAYNRNNSVAGGCHDEEQGLTPLGHQMLAAVNSAGMLMDCSHTGRRSSLDIMAASDKPVIFSHANPAALVQHGRNITDEQITACAATGGVICINGISAFLGNTAPSASDVLQHLRYVADLVGADHVGIGLDISFFEAALDDTPPNFDPAYWWPANAGYGAAQGISRITYTPIETWMALPDALAGAGFSAVEAANIMGGNMRRVAAQVWG